MSAEYEEGVYTGLGLNRGAVMRVRVWIAGAEGPSRDFELVEAPRVGDCISIAVAGRFEEGIVTSVIWQLVGIERSENDTVVGVEPVGSVTVIHVICNPQKEGEAGFSDHGVKERMLESAPAKSALAG
jgi:hypothetical protein